MRLFSFTFYCNKNVNRMESIKLLENSEALYNSSRQKAHYILIVSTWHKTKWLFRICSLIDKIRIIRCPIILMETNLQFYLFQNQHWCTFNLNNISPFASQIKSVVKKIWSFLKPHKGRLPLGKVGKLKKRS